VLKPLENVQLGFSKYLQIAFLAYALFKYLVIQCEILPQTTDWYTPKGLASPARVQQILSQDFQAQRIFQGVLQNGLLNKNTSLEDFMRCAAA